jgi:hypothetical protein
MIAEYSGYTEVCPHPNEVDRKRIAKNLAARERYKYVAPMVLDAEDGYVIRSPCCSRTVDPEGGIIDVARLEYQEGGFWRLYRMDDEKQRWMAHSEYLSLNALLARLTADTKREFWR